MAQYVLGRHRPTERVRYQIERTPDLQPLQHRFQIIHQPRHGIRHSWRVVASAMSAQVWRDDPRCLTKKAQLMQPLSCAAAIAMREYQRQQGLLGLYINHANSSQSIASRNIDRSPV